MTPPGGRETAGITTRLIVHYVRTHGGAAAVDDVLERAGEHRPLADLENERTWSTYEQKVALFQAVAAVLEDPDVGLHIGESVLHEQIGLPLRMVLWALGSPAQLLKNIARTGAKFSTVAEMTCPVATKASGTVVYRLHGGYRPNRFDCDYTRGLLSQAPALFGLPAADVRHDECQVTGAEACVYDLSWPRRSRLGAGRQRVKRLETELRLMTDQVESLQTAAAEIVAAETVDETIALVATRARSVVRAAGFIVVVQPLAGSEPHVQVDGLHDEEAARLRGALVAGAPVDETEALVVEIASPRRSYGSIAAVNPGPYAFFPDERRMLAAFADLAATALDATVSRDTVCVLSDLGRALADVTDRTEVCQRVAGALAQVVRSPIGAVALWDRDGGVLRFTGVRGLPPEMDELLRSVELSPEISPDLKRQLADPQPRMYRRATAHDPSVRALLDGFAVEAAMTVPIMARGTLLGQVIAGWQTSPPASFDGELIERMAGVAHQAATALENARLLEVTKHQALHDPLTGLPNRTLLDDRLHQAAARARRNRSLLAVLLVDLDGFKEINDSLGHRTGDAVLCEVAARLNAVLRDADTAARFGGDEFVLVCQDVTDLDDVEAIAHRVEHVIRQPITVLPATVTVGASVGVTIADGSIDDVDALLHLADGAMYQVKRRRPDRSPIVA